MSKESENIKLVPKVRFPEFDEKDEWVREKLGKFLEFKNGINAKREQYGKGIKFINVLDIIQNPFITYDKIIGSVEITEKEISKNEVSYGDILFQRSSETREDAGQANVYLDKERKAVFGGFVIRGKMKQEYVPIFLNYLLKTEVARKEITSRSAGSTRFNIGQDSLNEVEIFFPKSNQEQQKIAATLTSLDHLIATENEKLEVLKAHKKGLLQQLFPAKGEKVPKLRFEEFNGDWKETTLVQVAYYENGKAHEKEIAEAGKYIVVNSKFISSDGKVIKLSDSINCETKIGDILMVLSDVPNGKAIAKCFYVDKNETYTVNQRICRITGFDIESRFLFYVLNRNQYFLSFDDGVKQTNLRKDTVLNCPLLKPTDPKEQKKIADCIESIKSQIENQLNNIESLIEHKKGLMQQMFPNLNTNRL